MNAIEEGRVVAEAHFGADGPGFKNLGKLNSYLCDVCHSSIVTIDSEFGVTPFITRCGYCGEQAVSSMYRVDQNRQPTHEWTRPATLNGLNMGTIEHIRKGGLILKAISGNPDVWQPPVGPRTMGRQEYAAKILAAELDIRKS